jgi:hypothetical protein
MSYDSRLFHGYGTPLWPKTFTRLTSILANCSGLRFTQLPILQRDPFLTSGRNSH